LQQQWWPWRPWWSWWRRWWRRRKAAWWRRWWRRRKAARRLVAEGSAELRRHRVHNVAERADPVAAAHEQHGLALGEQAEPREQRVARLRRRRVEVLAHGQAVPGGRNGATPRL
jgi:hypothetical protein